MELKINKQYLAEVWNDIVKGIKKTPNSVLFWNGLVFLGFIVAFFVNIEVFVTVQGLASIFALAIVFDGDADKNQIWILGTAFFWLALSFVAVLGLGSWIGSLTVERFNNWLDKKREEPLTREQKKELWKQQHIQKKKSKRLSKKQ